MTAEFRFRAQKRPFRRWYGPFSPARGIKTGFRFHRGRLGTWVDWPYGTEFWQVVSTFDIRRLERLVLGLWGGGRVLLLPNGLIIKPLQRDDEVGVRVLLGGFRGPIQLERPYGTTFSLAEPGRLYPGDQWPGPTSTGLECLIQPDGSLECSWYHPTNLGRDEVRYRLTPRDPVLAKGFRTARPEVVSGRVRVTANGHVITSRSVGDEWRSVYVGRVDAKTWVHEREWIGRR